MTLGLNPYINASIMLQMLTIIVPSDNTPRIQEAHITIGHIVCELVERELAGAE